MSKYKITLELTERQVAALKDDIAMNLSNVHMVNNVDMHPIYGCIAAQLCDLLTLDQITDEVGFEASCDFQV